MMRFNKITGKHEIKDSAEKENNAVWLLASSAKKVTPVVWVLTPVGDIPTWDSSGKNKTGVKYRVLVFFNRHNTTMNLVKNFADLLFVFCHLLQVHWAAILTTFSI